MTYYRYYLEPSVVKNNGSAGFSPPGTQTHSRTSTPTHAASVTTTVTTPTSNIKPLSSLLGSQAKSLKLNVQVSSCHNKLPCCTGYVLACMLDMLHCDHIHRLLWLNLLIYLLTLTVLVNFWNMYVPLTVVVLWTIHVTSISYGQQQFIGSFHFFLPSNLKMIRLLCEILMYFCLWVTTATN